MNRNLTHLVLQGNRGFADEAGVALAEALTVNKTLCKITLSVQPVLPVVFGSTLHNAATLGSPAYEASSAMLRVNTSLRVPPFDDTIADQKLLDSHNQMVIEQGLNHVGRERLFSSSQTTRKEWVDALDELNSYSNVDETPEFNVTW
jgi:hypothetical protein